MHAKVSCPLLERCSQSTRDLNFSLQGGTCISCISIYVYSTLEIIHTDVERLLNFSVALLNQRY